MCGLMVVYYTHGMIREIDARAVKSSLVFNFRRLPTHHIYIYIYTVILFLELERYRSFSELSLPHPSYTGFNSPPETEVAHCCGAVLILHPVHTQDAEFWEMSIYLSWMHRCPPYRCVYTHHFCFKFSPSHIK